MVTAIILMHVERTKINETAQALADIPGITEVFSVSGHYDMVAIVRVNTNENLSELVTARMVTIPAIHSTETLLAFRTYSRHDLEAMFGLGMGDGDVLP